MANLLLNLSIISTFVPFLISTWLAKNQKKHVDLKLLWFVFSLAATTEVFLDISSRVGVHNVWIFHIYTPIEFVLILNILRQWQQTQVASEVIRLAIPVYIAIYLMLKLVGIEKFEASSFNYITRPLALSIIIIVVFHTLLGLWNNTQITLRSNYRFWFLIAMAIYYSSSTVLFSFTYLGNQKQLSGIVYIHAISNIIHNLLFTIGVLKVRNAQPAALQPSSVS